MAEEEVLQEPQAPKRKEKGDKTSMHLIVIVALLAIVIVLSVVMLSKLGKIFGGPEATPPLLTGNVKMAACQEMKPGGDEEIRDLAKDPIIVNLADGNSFVSAKISLCLDKKKFEGEEVFPAHVPQFMNIVNDTLSGYTYADFFPAGKKAAADTAGTPGTDKYNQKVEQIRQELSQKLRAFTNMGIKEAYFQSFVVQGP
jgi:flagellar basal body-associated protein FliL